MILSCTDYPKKSLNIEIPKETVVITEKYCELSNIIGVLRPYIIVIKFSNGRRSYIQ